MFKKYRSSFSPFFLTIFSFILHVVFTAVLSFPTFHLFFWFCLFLFSFFLAFYQAIYHDVTNPTFSRMQDLRLLNLLIMLTFYVDSFALSQPFVQHGTNSFVTQLPLLCLDYPSVCPTNTDSVLVGPRQSFF